MLFTARKKLFGFTLIELLIVIAILGILAAAVLVAVNPGKLTRQARDAARKNDIGSLATELQAYYTAPGQGVYPTSLGVLTAQGYLKVMPVDPTGGAYTYATGAGWSEVSLYDVLEEPTGAVGSLFCFKTTSGVAFETTAAGCAP